MHTSRSRSFENIRSRSRKFPSDYYSIEVKMKNIWKNTLNIPSLENGNQNLKTFGEQIASNQTRDFLCIRNSKLDVDPQRDDDASPMSTYRCMLRPT